MRARLLPAVPALATTASHQRSEPTFHAVPYLAIKFSSVTFAATASWGTSKYLHGFPPTVLA